MWNITYEEVNLVSCHRGTLPVILGCPHDGEKIPAGVPRRTRTGSPPGCPPFKTNRDRHTREIATGVAQRLLDVFGEAPYIVIAEYDREYIDANRPLDCAFEPPAGNEIPAAKQYYDEYHNTLRSFVDEIRAETGGMGLLFDFHGTRVIGEDPADLYLGTDNKRTITRLLRFDPQALWRRRSLRGSLGAEAAGYVVSPKKPDVKETKDVDGGYTVRTYGSSHEDGVDAIQLEIASTLRDDREKRASLIENLAFAIGNMSARYVCHR